MQKQEAVPFRSSLLLSLFEQSVPFSSERCSNPIAAEQKARTTYDNLLRLIDDPDVREPLKFLRAREIVHFQRFGDALRVVQDNLDAKNYYAYNPAIDIRPPERTRKNTEHQP